MLKAALDIYSGRLKGFAMLPEARSDRERYMKDFMCNLLMKKIKQVVEKPNLKADSTNKKSKKSNTETAAAA